jgi:hypothetical protein
MAPAWATPNRLADGTPTDRRRDRRLHIDRLVLVCGAVGLLIGLGFVVAGINSRPSTYAFVGVILIALTALVVLPSPWLPSQFARSSAVRVALLLRLSSCLLHRLDPCLRMAGPGPGQSDAAGGPDVFARCPLNPDELLIVCADVADSEPIGRPPTDAHTRPAKAHEDRL